MEHRHRPFMGIKRHMAFLSQGSIVGKVELTPTWRLPPSMAYGVVYRNDAEQTTKNTPEKHL
jgi:hypothetical protein